MTKKRIWRIILSNFVLSILFILIFSKVTSATQYIYDENSRLSKAVINSGLEYSYLYDNNGSTIQKKRILNSDNNLLLNSDFENATGGHPTADNWEYWLGGKVQGTAQVVNSPVANGQKAQRITATSLPNNGMLGLYQRIVAIPGQSISANACVLVESLNNARVIFQIDYYDASGNWISNGASNLTAPKTAFITMSASAIAPSNAAWADAQIVLLGVGDGGSGQVDVDSITARYSADLNLLTNPDFENATGGHPTADNWDYWLGGNVQGTAQVVNSPVANGQKAQRITATSLPNNGVLGLYQRIAAIPGQSISANARVWVENLNNARAVFQVDYYDASGNWISNGASNLTAPEAAFITMSAIAIAPSNAAWADVQIVLLGVGDGGSGQVDVDSITARYSADLNLLTNPDFENATEGHPTADNWEYWLGENVQGTAHVINSPVTNGQRAQRITATSLPNNRMMGLGQRVVAIPGQSISANARVWVESLNHARVIFQVDYFDANGNWISNGASYLTAPEAGFITMSASAVAPSNAVWADIEVTFLGVADGGSGQVDVDSVTARYS